MNQTDCVCDIGTNSLATGSIRHSKIWKDIDMEYVSRLPVFALIIALCTSAQLFAHEEDTTSAKEEQVRVKADKIANTSEDEEERNYRVYVTIGGGFFQEDTGSTIGSGSSIRFASGDEYNDWFGLEIFGEITPAISPDAVLEDLEQSLNQTILSYRIKTRNNGYVGILGKFSHEMKNGMSLFGKVGVAWYEAHRVSVDLTLVSDDDRVLFTYHELESDETGFTPVISIGVERPWPYLDSKHSSIELMLTKMLDDKVDSLSVSSTLKYTF